MEKAGTLYKHTLSHKNKRGGSEPGPEINSGPKLYTWGMIIPGLQQERWCWKPHR